MSEPKKIFCEVCAWKGDTEQTLVEKNPFAPQETIYGCPECKSIDCFVAACDEPGCWGEVCCGMPTPSGYRSTCGKHMPKENL